MVKAYSYIRMSTPEQLKGDSVRRQQKATDDYIREMGWELSAAWEQKRKSARSGSVTKQKLPHWLKFSVDGLRIEVIEDRASIIREIFELSRDGWGSYSIAKHLNQKGIETWGRSKMWQESYVKKLLDNRSLLGEYQPFKTFSDASIRQRVPDGEPVSGYYPVVIDEVLYRRQSSNRNPTCGDDGFIC